MKIVSKRTVIGLGQQYVRTFLRQCEFGDQHIFRNSTELVYDAKIFKRTRYDRV